MRQFQARDCGYPINLPHYGQKKNKNVFLKIANYSLLAVIGESKKIENARGTVLP